VQSLDSEKKVIIVMPALGGKLPQFDGGSIPVDDGVRQEMRQVLSESLPIPFLDTTANQLLQEARATFQRMGLDTQVIFVSANTVQLFLWRGDRIMDTLVLMLKLSGFNAEKTGLCIDIKTSNPKMLFDSLRDLAASPPPEPMTLVAKVINKQLEKWDHLLPDGLLARNYASHTLDVVGGHKLIQLLAQGS
jgi:ATP-dependent Lhr-like helicase